MISLQRWPEGILHPTPWSPRPRGPPPSGRWPAAPTASQRHQQVTQGPSNLHVSSAVPRFSVAVTFSSFARYHIQARDVFCVQGAEFFTGSPADVQKLGQQEAGGVGGGGRGCDLGETLSLPDGVRDGEPHEQIQVRRPDQRQSGFRGQS